ncbi:protein IQ-DOMAIN 9 isoform X2 [Diospyros lotus]|uniref:protein IQ-DOMAIN 9 isoform X2 n=1 Tax=Diospyros lotus TaxID=55363 RepID=UPI00225758BB|nr:protein IQ-DOMAIN 9 isoform X2 [Diospyros lotus]
MGSSATEKSNGVKHRTHSHKVSTKFANNAAKRNPRFLGMEVEDIAATKIQTAFRAYMARKKLRRLKGIFRLQILTQSQSVSKQASTTLSHLHSWSRIQGQIRARRVAMVTEGRIRQKKLENQLKLEAKLHDLEVEWNGGSETMEEILGRIHQREEAAGKRERALAYAFSHQWRANSNSILGPPELGKANWGWSWMERWIAARPWESRAFIQSSPKKPSSRPGNKAGKSTSTPTMKSAVSAKSISPNGKGPIKARKLSLSAAEKSVPQSNTT